MPDTPHLNLPLLSPSQAQKHVTVNEALARLDGMVQLRLISQSTTTPPAVFVDGDCYGVPTGAVNEWAGEDGNIAVAVNGGWDFVSPLKGFRAFILDEGLLATFDGTDWRAGGLSLTPYGAGLNVTSVEIDIPVTPGPIVTTPVLIPERAIVFGVTGVVVSAIGGAAAWRLGVSGDDVRFGSGLSTATNSWINGPSAPSVYWSPTALLISSEDLDFTGGTLRLAVHYAALSIPTAS